MELSHEDYIAKLKVENQDLINLAYKCTDKGREHVEYFEFKNRIKFYVGCHSRKACSRLEKMISLKIIIESSNGIYSFNDLTPKKL